MHQTCPLVGFQAERRRMRDALTKRESLFITGPPGAGKTALIQEAVSSLADRSRIVQLRYSAKLHSLAVDLTRSLLASPHEALRSRAKLDGDVDRWLARQTSVHLKGLLWSSLEAQPVTMVLDGVDRGSFPMYRFLQRLYFTRGMAIIAAARDSAPLGALARLFWDPRDILRVAPLNHSDAARLFEMTAHRLGLTDLNLEEFRDKVLEAARGNPGQIVEMCRLATKPAYRNGVHIKFAPLRMDAMVHFLG